MADMFRDVVNNIAMHTPVESAGMRAYYQNEISNLYNNLQQIDNHYVQGIQETIEVYQDENRLYNTQVIVGEAEQYIDGNAIYPVTEDNIFNINHTMKRYIMVNPAIRELYDNEKISGFNGRFIDVSEKEDNYEWNNDYLRIMDGVSMSVKDSDEEFAIHYEDDAPLLPMEQFNILESWHNMELSIARCVDPTDIEEEE